MILVGTGVAPMSRAMRWSAVLGTVKQAVDDGGSIGGTFGPRGGSSAVA